MRRLVWMASLLVWIGLSVQARADAVPANMHPVPVAETGGFGLSGGEPDSETTLSVVDLQPCLMRVGACEAPPQVSYLQVHQQLAAMMGMAVPSPRDAAVTFSGTGEGNVVTPEAPSVVLMATGLLGVVVTLRWKDRRERKEMRRQRGQMLRQERLAGCAEFV